MQTNEQMLPFKYLLFCFVQTLSINTILANNNKKVSIHCKYSNMFALQGYLYGKYIINFLYYLINGRQYNIS